MDVYEAGDGRRAVRAFSDEPVPRDALARALSTATRALTSGHLQPWRLFVVAGEPLADEQESSPDPDRPARPPGPRNLIADPAIAT